MFWILVLISLVTTLFFLFIGSFFFVVAERIVDEQWAYLFQDVLSINPNLSPTEVIVGTLLSYFILAGLISLLLRVSYDLKKRGDVYAIDEALKEGLLSGLSGLLLAGVMRFTGFMEVSNLGAYLAAIMFELKRNVKSALFTFLLITLTGWIIYTLFLNGLIRGDMLNFLYYLGLIFIPPLLVYIVRSI